MEQRRRGDRRSWAYLENWPVLSKSELRKYPKAFLAGNKHPNRVWEEHTSGSSGTPLTLFRSEHTEKLWYAQFEARVRRWHHVSRFDRWAIIGGQMVAPVETTKPPYWVWNAGLNQLYLSVYHISAQTAADYCNALKKYQITYLLGYPSALSLLAEFMIAGCMQVDSLKKIFSNAEMLLPVQRQIIDRAFNCSVVDTYGMSELAAAASECEEKNMHLWPDTGIVEVLSDDMDLPVPDGECGRLICTGLINFDMPLIRYQVGDRGALAPKGTRCLCGRNLPVLERIDGRIDDVILTRDGRRIGRLDSIFKSNLPVIEAQLIQEQIDMMRVKVVPAPGFDDAAEEQLRKRITERVGAIRLVVEKVGKIERGRNGKFKFVVNQLSISED